MKLPPASLLLAAIVALETFTIPAHADESKITPPPSAIVTQPKQPNTINIDFPGGSIAQLVAAISTSGGPMFNVIGDPDDLATVLPPFAVHNVNVDSFAAALRELLMPHRLTYSAINANSGSPVYTLRKFLTYENQQFAGSMFDSFQLAAYLGPQTVDDIVAAIRAAWELDPTHDANALRIKYHPPTKLLLLSGPNEAIATARQILNTLTKKPTGTAPSAPPQQK